MSEVATVDDNESWRETITRFTEPKMAMMLVLGFTAGLPFLLYFSTLSVWLERSDIDVALISFFSFFGLSYSFKFLWDRRSDTKPWRNSSIFVPSRL